MFRHASAAALCAFIPLSAWAEDITLRADISAATIYLGAAEIMRTTPLQLAAGEHEIFIPMRDIDRADRLQLTGPEGLTLAPARRIAGRPLPEGSLDTNAMASARAEADAATDAVIAAQDDIAAADAEVAAIEAQIAYLRTLTSGGADVAMPSDTAALPAMLSVIGQEMARASAELVETRDTKRALNEALADRQAELAEAMAALDALRPFGRVVDGIVVSASSDAAVDGVLTITYQSSGASWMPSYDLFLDTETDALSIERFIEVTTDGRAVWQDVAMTFSTSDLNRRRVPSEPRPSPVRIAPDGTLSRGAADGADLMVSPAPSVVAEAMAVMETDGLSIRYVYNDPVTVGPDGSVAIPFDFLDQSMETEARANPRSEDTAFLITMGDNMTGEPILPGPARFFRDGALVGEGELPLIPIGAEMELSFGPLDHLRLIWIDRSLAEGDRGVFVSSNTQERQIAFGVENTGDTTETVRLLYPVPFAEQEDVDLTVDLSRAPQVQDVDDMRGVMAWDLEIAAGATELIEMEVSVTWPEDQRLLWQP